MKVQSSVQRTAADAVMAKWSALSAGHDSVQRNGKLHYALLETMANYAPQRRQTPLVNAGYAARVAIVTRLLEKFVEFHNSQKIQLVVLGCGLDVVGVWSCCLDKQTSVAVYEVDCLEICEMKRQAILSSKAWKFDQVEGGQNDSIVVQGLFRGSVSEEETHGQERDKPNYFLLSLNLKNVESVKSALLSVLDVSRPTLVLSELVLAYLETTETDELLSMCSSQLCQTPNSALVIYEPLGASKDSGSAISVTAGYKRSYEKHFRSKLNSGQKQTEGSSPYFPIGEDLSQVESRVRNAGFPFSSATLAIRAAAHCFSLKSSTELFDDHAALALHLRTYAVGCAFSKGTQLDLMQSMCPWSSRIAANHAVSLTQDGTTTCAIQLEHQEAVRCLFEQTYKNFAQRYPAVKKMMKTALKTDLSGKPDSNSIGTGSAIDARYKKLGGAFIVACQAETSSGVSKSEGSVVGFIGLRPCGRLETERRGLNNGIIFEIHRLAVDASFQGRGIGKLLLQAAHRFVVARLGKLDQSASLVATTPSMLEPANHFYSSLGFKLIQQKMVGELQMNTYLQEFKS